MSGSSSIAGRNAEHAEFRPTVLHCRSGNHGFFSLHEELHAVQCPLHGCEIVTLSRHAGRFSVFNGGLIPGTGALSPVEPARGGQLPKIVSRTLPEVDRIVRVMPPSAIMAARRLCLGCDVFQHRRRGEDRPATVPASCPRLVGLLWQPTHQQLTRGYAKNPPESSVRRP
jgi:hypothetical protein